MPTVHPGLGQGPLSGPQLPQQGYEKQGQEAGGEERVGSPKPKQL